MIQIVKIDNFYFVKPTCEVSRNVFPPVVGKDASCFKATKFVLFLILCRCLFNNIKYILV